MKRWYEKRIGDLEREAAGGDGRALFALAQAVDYGFRGAKADSARALSLYERAAATGHARAARTLGQRYHDGDGVPEDPVRARAWWRRAAELGDMDAMANLVSLVGSQDPAEAAEGRRWLVMGASRGQPFCIEQLKARQAGKPLPPADLGEFAGKSLEELAAAADDDEGGLDETLELAAEAKQLNHLLGRWIEALLARWPDLEVGSEADCEPIDFPGLGKLPAAVTEDGDDLQIRLATAGHPIECWCSYDDEEARWSLNVFTFSPHLSDADATALVDALRQAADALGLGALSSPDE